ncbi:ribonuclease 4 [Pipistrellus kuhlii]|uniref:Ribonuclease 4 n=1 Tax=Pipistrellus kuhlii TaxID=59472 RepID=A0A7J8B4W6_PIPKU|nr:ribonuclease 4 [Pipistrellus kuhlii]XP_036303458.1 ribonuclease 4 [Pipistrellus kuhlii]XP_036303469.1 ribonuclease 4 [Pipistrellus kuhlii]XP_045439978.1 ribonuclease 4 [Pipistrellus kuhlii]KAF6393541.1 hypothetical protein mPipKuh1_014948 [Pipistrellus kuhlii]
MALQKTLSLLLLLLVTLLGLGLVQPSYGQSMYQRFQRQHVDTKQRGGTSSYCNKMMQTQGMMRPTCKQFNTFIHAGIKAINNICRHSNIRCKNGKMNCHKGGMRVTDCKLTGGSPGNCKYQGRGSFRSVVIACDGKPLVPVHFDG